jgi:hypothetical protein
MEWGVSRRERERERERERKRERGADYGSEGQSIVENQKWRGFRNDFWKIHPNISNQ